MRRALLAGVIFEAALVFVAMAAGALFSSPPLRTLRADWADAALGAAATLPMFALLAFCLWVPLPPLRRLLDAVDRAAGPLFRGATVGDVVAISALAGLGEEMLFRGALQGAMADAWGPVPALVAASALFGIVHAITPTYAILAALIGAWLGWLFLATQNLLVPVVAHALYDFVALMVLVVRQRRRAPPA